MNIRIEKKGDNKFLVCFIGETNVQGFYLAKSDLAKLNDNINQILQYDKNEIGDSL